MAGIVRAMPSGAQRFRAASRRLVGGVLAATLAGCAGGAPPPGPGSAGVHLIRGVPFLPQEVYQCGPAALAMVLRHHGAPPEVADPEAIGAALRLPSGRGTLNLELELQARRLGFGTRAFAGTLAAARDELRRGRPLIVFQDLGPAPLVSRPHFAVLIGFDDQAREVILHSGRTPYLRTGYAAFDRTWAARRRWTLLVLPPGPAVDGAGGASPGADARPGPRRGR
jgi:hypothetical protein